MNINLTLIGQIGTFLVFWWFLYKVIWPIFARVADERRQKIAEGLSMADQAKHSMAAAEEESREMVSQAKTQATDIVGRAHKQADQVISEARNEAQETGRRELEHAREEIEQEKRRAREELRAQLAGLVIEGAEQVIGREIKADDHSRLLRELSEKL
ncbi:F0F1 ATP synthase subunit B [Suttonella sp. R2A3]|uniref:F0F1 ATP synthase subunit B n=1 Tax=Suttonella sp. R2A3 TaxID=2908648 RepID=UPI001F1C5E9E|nr:F0F1 ATP synthase subunit B [Suttonella sp. R2A3]UJF23972.1 F0F1 ATP synthase subunit B [Suttonella sp. R2A3]